MATTTWSLSIGHIIMSTLSCHIYEGHTDQNAPLSGEYTVDYLHISPNCQYILSSISCSYPKPLQPTIAIIVEVHRDVKVNKLRSQATQRFYLAAVEKNWYKACYHCYIYMYVTDQKWWTRLVHNVDSVS